MINRVPAADDVLGMLKRLGVIAALSVGFSSLASAPASAAGCGLAGLMPCASSQPSSQPASQPSSQPSSQPAPQPSSQPAPPSSSPGHIAEAPGGAERILELVNRERAAAGLAPLEHRGEIVRIAVAHSRAMADRRDIWHNDAYFTASTRHALGARGLGENVAVNGSVDEAHRRLMASPAHRANILNGSFDAAGMAVVHDESGALYVTQNFVDSSAPSAAPARKSGKAKAVAGKSRKSTARKGGARKPRTARAGTRRR